MSRIPILFVTAGPPGSGKSTFCRKLAEEGVKHISRDEIRKDFGEYTKEKGVQEIKVIEGKAMGCLLNGQDVVVDANHVLPDQRWEILSFAKDLWTHFGRHTCKKILYFPTAMEVCMDRRAPEIRDGEMRTEVIYSQFTKLVEPETTEQGHVYVIGPTTPADVVLSNRLVLPFEKVDLRCE